jgi:pilus assembly protein Flp/PilA
LGIGRKRVKIAAAPTGEIAEMSRLLRLWKDDQGATAIEYALIAGLVSIAIYAGVAAFGGGVNDLFNLISDNVQSSM